MAQKISILTIMIVVLRSSSSELLSEEDVPNHNIELAQLAAKIFWDECQGCKLAVIIYADYDNTVDLFFTQVSEKPYGMSIFVLQLDNFTVAEDVEYPDHRPDMTIMFLNEDNYGAADDMLFGIELLPLWNNRGKFLVVSAGVPEAENDWIQTSFEAFWERQALRVLICFWRDDLKLISYNPFQDNFGYDVSNRSDLLEIFSHKIRNMYGYPLRMYHIDTVLTERAIIVTKNGKESWVGFDGMYMTTVVETLNASMEVHRVSEDFEADILKNGDLDTPFGEIMRFFANVWDFDILMNAARTYTDNDLDKACLYERDDLLIVVPKAKQIPPYLLIFQIVNYDVWCASLGSLLVVSLTMILIRKYAELRLDVANALMDNYRILLNESPPDRPRKQQERLLFVLWVLHCIVFSTLFQTIFMTALVVPRYGKDMDTFDDLVNAKLNVFTSEYRRIQIVRGMQGENQHFLQFLKSVPKQISTFGETMDWIADYRQDNGFIISQEQMYEFKVRDKQAAHGAYHVMKDSAMPNAFCYCIRREKLYYDEIQDIIWRIQDAGLHIHWRDFNYGLEKERMDSNGTDAQGDQDDNQVLGLDHLQSAFVLLLIGYILALVVFCCELVHYKCKRNPDEVLFEYIP